MRSKSPDDVQQVYANFDVAGEDVLRRLTAA